MRTALLLVAVMALAGCAAKKAAQAPPLNDCQLLADGTIFCAGKHVAMLKMLKAPEGNEIMGFTLAGMGNGRETWVFPQNGWKLSPDKRSIGLAWRESDTIDDIYKTWAGWTYGRAAREVSCFDIKVSADGHIIYSTRDERDAVRTHKEPIPIDEIGE